MLTIPEEPDRPERYGKANGNGPLHLLADFNGTLVTLCGVKRFEESRYPPYRVEEHGVCVRCEDIRRVATKPVPAERPSGPDLVTPAIVQARTAAVSAGKEYSELIAANRRAFAWLKDFPEERKAFIERLRAADVPLGAIGELLDLTRERVRQLEAG